MTRDMLWSNLSLPSFLTIRAEHSNKTMASDLGLDQPRNQAVALALHSGNLMQLVLCQAPWECSWKFLQPLVEA